MRTLTSRSVVQCSYNVSFPIKIHLGRENPVARRTSLFRIGNYHDLVSWLNHRRAIVIIFVTQRTIGFARPIILPWGVSIIAAHKNQLHSLILSTNRSYFAFSQRTWLGTSFERRRGTDTCNIRLVSVGYFGGHFIESVKYTWFLLI